MSGHDQLFSFDSPGTEESFYLFITDDAFPNVPTTALVMFGAATAIEIAINASIIAYSTIVTPFDLFFFCIRSPFLD